MKDSGVIVHFVLDSNDYWTDDNHHMKLNGMYSPADNKVYVTCGSDYQLRIAETHVIWHELGHALDNHFGTITEENTFRRIYNEEANSDVILGKRRCEKNGYHYEINDFSHVITYDNCPTITAGFRK